MPFTKGHTLYDHPNSIATRFQRGQSLRRGVKHTPEAISKMSENRKGKALGSDNASWKGGATPFLNKLKRLTEYKNWQSSVMKRDNFTCRKCGTRGGDLTAHHLTSFAFLVNVVFEVRTLAQATNCFHLWKARHGVTLCEPCHARTPNFGWRATLTPRDRTVYPVILGLLLAIFLFAPSPSKAATFGNTTAGGTEAGFTADQVNGTHSVAPAEAGTLDSVSYYSLRAGADKASKGVVYVVSGVSLVEVGGETSINSSMAQWFTSTGFTASISVQNYYIGFGADAVVGGAVSYFYDTVSSASRLFYNFTYSTFSDPGGTTASARKVSIYATYTATGGAPAATRRRNPPPIIIQ